MLIIEEHLPVVGGDVWMERLRACQNSWVAAGCL